jgi:hypothetical protein
MMRFKKILIILITVVPHLLPLIASTQISNTSDSLLSQKDVLKDFSWFRERMQRTDGEKRWRYFLHGHEYEIEINYFTTKDLMFSTKEGLVKFLSAGLKKKSQRMDNVPWLPQPNRISYTSDKLDTISLSFSRYIVPNTESFVYDINMLRYDTRDTLLEKEIVYSIIKNGIKDSFFLTPGPNMIDFAGRVIQIKNNFKWMAPDNIYCPSFGQMNWSIHSSIDKAMQARDLQIINNSDSKLAEILKKDTVTVVFEGSTMEALRITYKAKEPRIFWGKGSKILLVYYIVAPVRGRFVTCVLSHYDDQLVNGNLPPPLDSVMSLKNE